MNTDKMIRAILDERIINDGLAAKGWKKYNDGINKAVQVIREHQANEPPTESGCDIAHVNDCIPLVYFKKMVDSRHEPDPCERCVFSLFDTTKPPCNTCSNMTNSPSNEYYR